MSAVSAWYEISVSAWYDKRNLSAWYEISVSAWYVEKLYVEISQPQNKKGGAETVSAVRLHGTLINLSAWCD